MYKLNFTKLQSSVFRLLCIKSGISLNQREISIELNVSPTAVSKALIGLNYLLKIKRNPRMNLISIELNRDDENVINLKRVDNLKQIYESGLIAHIEKHCFGSTVILFGSYSLGEDIEKSDIDIAIIGSNRKMIGLDMFEKIFNRDINLNFYNNFKMNKELLSSILNGITLSGVVEL